MVGEPPVTVVKVGGSLLEGRGDLRRVAAAIGERCLDGGSLLVIASALKGVTDLLDQAATQARDRRLHNGHLGETLERLRRRHVEMAADVADDGSALNRIQAGLDEVETLVDGIGEPCHVAPGAHVAASERRSGRGGLACRRRDG